MNIFQTLVLGIVEGLTEFLPISSTFHLIVTSKILGLDSTEYLKLFNVVIQSGAILALLFIYTRTLLTDRKLLVNVANSFLPTAIVGFILHGLIKNVFFESDLLILVVFILVGIIFLVLEKVFAYRKIELTKDCSELTAKQSILVGFAQALSVVPGVSRAGSVIVAMMCLGYKREEAAKYTFLLSMPTIMGAGFLDLYQGREMLFNIDSGWSLLLLGILTAFFTAYFVVKWLTSYLATHTLAIFGWYRLVIATLLVIFKVLP